MELTNKEKLNIVMQRIKDLSLDRQSLFDQIINDIGWEGIENATPHPLFEEIDQLRLQLNAATMEKNSLQDLINSDIIE